MSEKGQSLKWLTRRLDPVELLLRMIVAIVFIDSGWSKLLNPLNFSTDILGTFFHRTFFGFQLQLGNQTMGATVAAMMFLIILFGVILYLFGWQRRITTYEV